MLQLLYYLIWYLITVVSTMADIEQRTLSRKEKRQFKIKLLKGAISATLLSIFKAFSLSRYLSMCIKVYIIKWVPFVLLIQSLKKKISGLRVAEKKNTFITFPIKT